MMQDTFVGHLESSTEAPKLAINVSELLPIYDGYLTQLANKYNREAITSEIALTETTYVFESEEDLIDSNTGLANMMLDIDILHVDEDVQLEYVEEVRRVTESLMMDFSILVRELNVYPYLKENDLTCVLYRTVGEHMVYQIVPKDAI